MMFAPSITPMEQHKLGRLHHPLVLLSIGALAGGSLDGGVEHASLAHRHTELMKSILPPAKMQPVLCLAKQP